jgi:hypothetical protein
MFYKPDWMETREWLTGWWTREIHGHWALGVLAPRATPLPPVPAQPVPSDNRLKWMDAEGNYARTLNGLSKTYFGGVFFPSVTAGLGPGCMDLFLGCEPGFMPETVWYKPCISDPAKAHLSWNPENIYWKWVLKNTRTFHRQSAGKCLTIIPDLIEGLDVISELVGTEELLTYLIDCPQEIHRLLDQVTEIYFKAFDPLYNVLKDDRNGNGFIAFNAWGPGRTLKTQCDFSAMISPDMFAEFVCPYLERQCARVDFSTYHLDGPNAIRHLPHLLKVPSLKAIQWTPGTPNPDASNRKWWKNVWEPVYAAGKSAMVLGCPPEDVEPFLKEFGQKGTMFTTGTDTEDQARRLIDQSVNWDA